MSYRFLQFSVTFFCLLGLSFAIFYSLDDRPSTASASKEGKVDNKTYLNTPDNQKNKIYFVGDVMLARHVETLINKNGLDYPFLGMDFVDTNKSFLFGNFEASIPLTHQKTANHNLSFSVASKNIGAMRKFGFTHLSLANNHSLDFGSLGLKNTITAIRDNKIKPFGNPGHALTSSVTYVDVNDNKVAILGVNATYGKHSVEEIGKVIAKVEDISDLQIVYIHWGNEYKLNSSANQKNISKLLAGMGVDIIIGHHPHVVQEIEIINDTLVFYSLGNFIFDQYFSTDVQQGLVLQIKPILDDIEVTLIPVSSLNKMAQPHPMEKNQKTVFLNKLANKSELSLKQSIKEGKILFNFK